MLRQNEPTFREVVDTAFAKHGIEFGEPDQELKELLPGIMPYSVNLISRKQNVQHAQSNGTRLKAEAAVVESYDVVEEIK